MKSTPWNKDGISANDVFGSKPAKLKKVKLAPKQFVIQGTDVTMKREDGSIYIERNGLFIVARLLENGYTEVKA